MQVKHEDAVDCAQLAGETEGYSGADLRAIVSEAQLAAVMARLEDLKASEAAGSPHDPHATQEAPALTAEVCVSSSVYLSLCVYSEMLDTSLWLWRHCAIFS